MAGSSLYGGSGIPVDDDLEPVRPALIWLDRRAHDQTQQVRRTVPLDRLVEITGARAERTYRRFGRARESPRPGRQPEDDRRPDVARAQASRPIFAVSLMSATSAFSSRSASFLNRTQVLPTLAFGSRSTYRSAA